MGRRAVHYTLSERLAAKRAQHAKYSKSDRGRAAQARYLSKRKHAPPPVSIASRVDIPDAMLTRAMNYKPISSSFYDGHAPDLGLRHSPFTFTIPDAESLAMLEDNGEEVLHIKLDTMQSLWVCAEGSARFKAWSGEEKDGAAIVEAGIMELEGRIRAWKLVASDTRWTKLGMQLREVYLDWGAKRAVWLAEELEVRQRGCKRYVAAYTNLPPQVLHRANFKYLDDTAVSGRSGDEEEEVDLFAEEYE